MRACVTDRGIVFCGIDLKKGCMCFRVLRETSKGIALFLMGEGSWVNLDVISELVLDKGKPDTDLNVKTKIKNYLH